MMVHSIFPDHDRHHTMWCFLAHRCIVFTCERVVFHRGCGRRWIPEKECLASTRCLASVDLDSSFSHYVVLLTLFPSYFIWTRRHPFKHVMKVYESLICGFFSHSLLCAGPKFPSLLVFSQPSIFCRLQAQISWDRSPMASDIPSPLGSWRRLGWSICTIYIPRSEF